MVKQLDNLPKVFEPAMNFNFYRGMEEINNIILIAG